MMKIKNRELINVLYLKMIKKSSILIGIIISMVLLIASAKYYAAGSQFESGSIMSGWKNNYPVNPFGIKALDDSEKLPGNTYLRKVIPFFRFWFISY